MRITLPKKTGAAICCFALLMAVYSCRKEESLSADLHRPDPVALAQQAFLQKTRDYRPDTASLSGLLRQAAVLRWKDAGTNNRGDTVTVNVPISFTTEFRTAGPDGDKGALVSGRLRARRIGEVPWRFTLVTLYPASRGGDTDSFTGTVLSEDWLTGKGRYYHAEDNRVLTKNEIATREEAKQMGFVYDCWTTEVWACVNDHCTLRDKNVCGWTYDQEASIVDDLGGGGGGSGGENSENPNSTIDFSCASFIFVPTTSSFQEAGVKNIRMKVRDMQRNINRDIYMPTLVFGLPTFMLPNEAATFAASAVNNAADAVWGLYRASPTLPNDPVVQNKFIELLRGFLSIKGGTVQKYGPQSSSKVIIRDADYDWFGSGNCDG